MSEHVSIRILPMGGLVFFCCCALAGPVGAKNGHVTSRYTKQPMRIASLGARPANAPAPGSSIHIVKKGETLWRISRQHGLSVADLSALNNLADPTAIRMGQKLRLRASPSTAQEALARIKAPIHTHNKAPAKTQPTKPLSKTRPTKHVHTKTGKPAKNGRYPLTWPVEGTITSRFGKRSGRAHDGIDISAPTGSAVRAAAAGEVLFSATHGSYGNLVVVKHVSGLVTVYAHNDRNLVRKGQAVNKGQLLGKVGQTGRATGPHLHFEVRRGTTPQNPLRFLPP